MADDDRLSAALERIKQNHRQHVSVNFPAPGIRVSRCHERWPCEAYRAAAALDAVLAEHRRDHDKTPFCEGCCFAWPCATVRAITRELTGETGRAST